MPTKTLPSLAPLPSSTPRSLSSICSIPGCGCAVHHPASDFCRAHVHQARCFDVVAVDPADPQSRHDLVVIAISDEDARRIAFTRLASRARGHWALTYVAEMELAEAG